MVSCSWKQTLGRFALDSSFEKYFDCYTDDIGKACLAYLSNGHMIRWRPSYCKQQWIIKLESLSDMLWCYLLWQIMKGLTTLASGDRRSSETWPSHDLSAIEQVPLWRSYTLMNVKIGSK